MDTKDTKVVFVIVFASYQITAISFAYAQDSLSASLSVRLCDQILKATSDKPAASLDPLHTSVLESRLVTYQKTCLCVDFAFFANEFEQYL